MFPEYYLCRNEKSAPVKSEYQRIATWTVAAACIVYVIGWFINVMDVDASQYASMSLEMLRKADYLHFTDRGVDYLDKPPMVFWTSGLSMSIFGINNVAYRIPAFLATLLTLYATYRLATVFYSAKTGFLAVCILATTQAVFLINHDVRTDTWLMCWFAFSMWQFAEHLNGGGNVPLLLGFAGTGLAMLTKGPIGLIAPGMGVAMHLLLKRDWSNIFHFKWVAGLVVVAILLLPMAYGLYTQFDLHPEKVVNGNVGVSGLRFYFWTQSFGRITGESIWDNGAGPFFLTHSTLWAFAPWSLLLIMAIGSEIRGVYRHFMGKRKKREFFILFGFLLPFMALSSSKYQLPHYAFIVYPLGAIMTARYVMSRLHKLDRIKSDRIFQVHLGLVILCLATITYLVIFAFPERMIVTAILAILSVLTFGFVHFGIRSRYAGILSTITTAIFINLILNFIFYPELLRYQAGSELGSIAQKQGVSDGTLFVYKGPYPYSLDFYAQTLGKHVFKVEDVASQKNVWVVTGEQGIAEIRALRPDLTVLGESLDYPVSQLSLEFLDPRTRESTVRKAYLVKL